MSDLKPLEQARQYLLTLESEYEIDLVNELTWNLTELPVGAKHWHIVVVKRETGDLKSYQVFWYNSKTVAYCKNVHFIDFDEVRRTLTEQRDKS